MLTVHRLFKVACREGDLEQVMSQFTDASFQCSTLEWAVMVLRHAIEMHDNDVAMWLCEMHPSLKNHHGNNALARRLCQCVMRSQNMEMAVYFQKEGWISAESLVWADVMRDAIALRHYLFMNWTYINIHGVRVAVENMKEWVREALATAVFNCDPEAVRWLMIRCECTTIQFHSLLLKLLTCVQTKVDAYPVNCAVRVSFQMIEMYMSNWIERIATKERRRWNLDSAWIVNRTGKRVV